MSQNVEVSILDEYLTVNGVEFVGLVTKNGRLVDYRTRKGLELSEEQKQVFFMSISLYQTMQQDFDMDLGAVRYTITERENCRIIAIPKEQDTVIIIMKGTFAHTVKKILDAVNHARSQENIDKNTKNR